MSEPIRKVERRSMRLGENGTDYGRIADFQGGMTRVNPHILHDYGRNIYSKGRPIGYALDVRICGYRGLPVNQIRSLAFEVDGFEIPDAWKTIRYDDREYAWEDVGADKFDNSYFWKYGDYLRVFIKVDGGIPQGIHRVKFGLALRDHYNSTAFCEKPVTIV